MSHAIAAAAHHAGRMGAWLIAPIFIVGMVLSEQRIATAGRTDLATLTSVGIVPFLAAIVACWLVGFVLTLRVPGNVVGWLFLGLGSTISAGGFFDAYANDTLRAEPNTLPLGDYAAVAGDSIFVWWFLFLALILQLTPTGKSLSARWSALVRITVVSAIAFFAAVLFRSTPLEGENVGLVSPLAMPRFSAPFAAVGFVAILVLGLCLLASVYALVARFRRSHGDERRQLLWLVAGSAPLPFCLAVSFGAAFTGHDLVAGAAVLVGLIGLAVGAGFSVAKFRLYGVEQVVSRATGYALASASVIAVYAIVVLVLTRSTPGIRASSTVTTILATLAAAAVASPAYRWARTAVDRRFNRRRFDAVQVVKKGLELPAPVLDELIAVSLADPSARILFRTGDAGWVGSDGLAVIPGGDAVDVIRRAATAAKIEFDPRRTDRGVVEAVAKEAAAEIDNLGLRAELARKLQEVSKSRARLAGAHLEERRRMERDLHDGAQQRLLAIALQLQSAKVNGSERLLREATELAISHLGTAVQELRDLASGLQPAALAGGGLRAAVEDLADRTPLQMSLNIPDQRFPAAAEGAAWFVIAEAVSNVVKHAGVDALQIVVVPQSSQLRVSVTDEGIGGADGGGRGLQGLADRVSALGGSLSVETAISSGTRVEAVIPCEW